MSIETYLPKKAVTKTKDTSVITGRIPRPVFKQVVKIMDEDELSWADLLTASMMAFLEGRGVKFK